MPVVDLFEGLNQTVELWREQKLIRLVFLSKKEQQHKGLQFLTIFLAHISHDS